MFAGNAGLASDAQACLEFGTWDYIGFERDAFIWKQACDVVGAHMSTLDRKEKEIKGKLKANMKILPILKKIRETGIESLSEEQVGIEYILYFLVCRKSFMKKRAASNHRMKNMPYAISSCLRLIYFRN